MAADITPNETALAWTKPKPIYRERVGEKTVPTVMQGHHVFF
jgi:hypothetical protein